MKKTFLNLLLGVALGAVGLLGFQKFQSHSADQPYAGQNERQISSLSNKDIDDLENGRGWGLAKPAEFNGYPGPAHVLEFSERLNLDSEQSTQIQTAFDRMKLKASELGAALIEAEEALDVAFKSGSIDADILADRLAKAEAIRASLRSVHLSAHLEITPLLSREQKELYASLRGYGSGHNEHSGH